MRRPIYLDNHATTPCDPRVVEAMLPYFTETFGNAASATHSFGWEAAEAVELARSRVAALIGAKPKEIVFTSGATESDNLALKGAFEAARARGGGNHIITTAIEHPAVVDTARRLEQDGAEISTVAVGPSGVIDPDAVRAAIRPDTILVSVIAANNEIGTVQPLAELGEIAHEAGALLHTDAAQAVARIPLDAAEQGFDLLSLSAHKMYGPKGIGALYVRRGVKLALQMHGGGHEHGLRSGTLDVPSIVGLGTACEIAAAELEAEAPRLLALRTRLYDGLRAELDELHVHGDLERRLPGNLNLSFAYVEGEALITGLKRIALSAGSACSSGSAGQQKTPSRVLRAIGVSDDLAHAALRFGIGRFNTEDEIDFAIAEVVRVVKRLREISPLYEMAKRGEDPRAAWGN